MNKQKLVDIFEKHTPKTEMSEDETLAMVNLLMSKDPNISCSLEEIDKESEIYKHMKPLVDAFQAQVFLSRLKHFTSLKISLGALVLLMHHMESAGAAVMMTFYLYNKVPENTIITIETISEIFPWGFFSDQQLKDIWGAQKVDYDTCKEYTCIGAPDNMIDYLESWK